MESAFQTERGKFSSFSGIIKKKGSPSEIEVSEEISKDEEDEKKKQEEEKRKKEEEKKKAEEGRKRKKEQSERQTKNHGKYYTLISDSSRICLWSQDYFKCKMGIGTVDPV